MDSPLSSKIKSQKRIFLKEVSKVNSKPFDYSEIRGNKSKATTLIYRPKKDISFCTQSSKPEISYSQPESFQESVKLPFIPKYHQSTKLVSPFSLNVQLTESNAPPRGRLTLRKNVPKKPFEPKFRCSAKSQAGQLSNGMKKTNQDSFLLMFNVFKMSFNFAIGVFDGHGSNGHLVSQFIKQYFTHYFLSSECLLLFKKYVNCPSFHSNTFRAALNCFYRSAEAELMKEEFDSIKSGTTAVIVVSYGDRLICLNTGDSRAIYINNRGETFTISQDHKPNEPNEKSRIIASGGMVISEDNETYRVYFSNKYEPGLAISRSIGDFDAKAAGIISEPDIIDLSIRDNGIKVIIVASDGLWDCFNNEEITELIQPFMSKKDSTGASKELLEKARDVWTDSDTNYIDDITVIVLFV